MRRCLGVALTFVSVSVTTAAAQAITGPDTVLVQSGALTLRALLWRPVGSGPFPAVLFNHGRHGTGEPIDMGEPAVIGPVFARHGFVLLYLFRQGVGLSTGQGTAEGDLMERAMAAEGQQGRNREQLQLLEKDELNEALSALAVLHHRREVDPNRVAVAGHSFGASLTLLLAERDTSLRAAVVFSGSAVSWDRSPELRRRLEEAVGRVVAPVFFIHAANDYSVAPGTTLAAEMERLGRPHRLKVYPAVGRTPAEGHALVYLRVAEWEPDVFDFLDFLHH